MIADEIRKAYQEHWLARESAARPWLTEQPEPMPQATYNAWVNGRGVPERYLDEVLEGMRETPPVAEVRAFMGDPKRSLLLLIGTRGVGKTIAASFAAVRWLGRYVLAAEISQAYRELHYREIVRSWCGVGLLVIDELGREPTDADQRSRATMWEVVERRFSARRKTILVSNTPEKLLRERYDEPMWDRISGDGGVFPVIGASLRQRGAA